MIHSTQNVCAFTAIKVNTSLHFIKSDNYMGPYDFLFSLMSIGEVFPDEGCRPNITLQSVTPCNFQVGPPSTACFKSDAFEIRRM